MEILKTWRLDRSGTYLDGERSAPFKIEDYDLEKAIYFCDHRNQRTGRTHRRGEYIWKLLR